MTAYGSLGNSKAIGEELDLQVEASRVRWLRDAALGWEVNCALSLVINDIKKVAAQVDSRPSRAPFTFGAVTTVVRPVHGAALSEETPLPHSGRRGDHLRRHPRRSLRAVELSRRMRQNTWAPSSLRNRPAIFCGTFILLLARSAWLLANGTLQSVRKAWTWERRWSRRSSRFLGLDFFCAPPFFARADGARGF